MQWLNQTGFRRRSRQLRAPARPKPWWWSKPARNALKIVAIFFVLYFFILPLIPGFGKAVHDLQQVNPRRCSCSACCLRWMAVSVGFIITYCLL